MKKLLLFLICANTLFVSGQNVTENKVSVNYIQLPTNVIAKQYVTYDIAIVRTYESANEDSLGLYQARLESAAAIHDAEMSSWKQIVHDMDRNYLAQMANWEKQTNSGTAASVPQKPNYPNQPMMDDVKMPLLHTDLENFKVDKAVNLKGYTRGAGGALLTLEIFPISSMNIIESKSGEGPKIKYSYKCNYQMPIGVKIEVPGQGIVLQTIVSNGQSSYTMKSFSSKYEHQLWLMDNQGQFWIDLEKSARNKALRQLNREVNDKCGFPVRNWATEVYTVKKFKAHVYTDLTNAYTMATQGYSKIHQSRDRKEAKAKLLQAINAWKKILEESNIADSKSRVNDKVTALIQCNIAEAYIWLSLYDDAEKYINLVKSCRVNKFKRRGSVLDSLLKQRRLRWNSYFG